MEDAGEGPLAHTPGVVSARLDDSLPLVEQEQLLFFREDRTQQQLGQVEHLHQVGDVELALEHGRGFAEQAAPFQGGRGEARRLSNN